MNLLNERPIVSGLVLGAVLGILLGLLIGWVLWPVQWYDTMPVKLRDDYQADYVQMTADSYTQTGNLEKAEWRMQSWQDEDPGPVQYTCQLASQAPAGPEKQNLLNLANALSPGVDCQEMAAAAPVEEEGQPLLQNIMLVCGVMLVALVLVGAVYYIFVLRPRQAPAGEELPEGEPTATLTAASRTIPLAQFPTEFNIGHDTYDDSFSIETATGEFLGECGVGISESIGVGAPKKVTAFEVWLFDKNDIRTVTKVIMSEHAYYDEALRAKLAPKGEAVMAKPDETVVLETASLIINARLVELEYGAGELPASSFFNRMVVELAAWAKEGAEPVEPTEEPGPDSDSPDDFEL